MNNESGATNRTIVKALWVPLLMMGISAAINLVWLIYYLYLYVSESPSISIDMSFLFSAIRTLSVPLFVLGIAVLLMLLTNVRQGIATWSRYLFYCGALIFLIGSLINIAIQWSYHFSYDWIGGFDALMKFAQAGDIIYLLADVLCIIAVLFLVWSYMKGDVSTKPRKL